jgi:hypothetical protein
MASIVERIAGKAGIPDLARILAELPFTDLQSLLHEVYRLQAARRTPAQVLAEYGRSRLFGAGVASPAELLELRGRAAVACEGFELVDLSPVTPFGTVSAVAPISPDWSIAALHGAEVASDPTNVLALEVALRRKADPGAGMVAVGTVQRVVRPQRYADPKALGHFTLLALVTAGRDRGHFGFEAEALAQHLDAHLRFIAGYFGRNDTPQVAYTAGGPAPERDLRIEAARTAAERHGASFAEEAGRDVGSYYKGFCFHIFLRERQLADGGMVDWTQQLLSNAKERLLISGMGLEFLPRLRAEIAG